MKLSIEHDFEWLHPLRRLVFEPGDIQNKSFLIMIVKLLVKWYVRCLTTWMAIFSYFYFFLLSLELQDIKWILLFFDVFFFLHGLEVEWWLGIVEGEGNRQFFKWNCCWIFICISTEHWTLLHVPAQDHIDSTNSSNYL